MHRRGSLGIVVGSVLLGGCGGPELPGHYWNVVLDGVANECTGNAPDYHAEYEYRVELDGNNLTLAIGEDVFATGTLEACSVSYSSLAWSTYRDDHEIQWEIVGQARVNVGANGGCLTGTDWEGTETFLITNSSHPDVQPGCTYTLEVNGKYLQEIEGGE